MVGNRSVLEHYASTLSMYVTSSDWPETLEISTVRTHGNESMNVFAFQTIDTTRISAIYSVLVEEIDIDDSMLSRFCRGIDINPRKHENHISINPPFQVNKEETRTGTFRRRESG